MTETQGRSKAIPEGEVAEGEVVELQHPRSYTVSGAIGGLVFALFTFLVLVLVPDTKPEHSLFRYIAPIAIPAFSFMGLYYSYRIFREKAQARADSNGITGYHDRSPFKQRFVPWSDVATCEIETHYDTFGKPILIKPILKSEEGKTLISLNLLYTKMEDQERLVKYIKAKLPKAKYDFWE